MLRRTSRFDYFLHIQVKERKKKILLFQGNHIELSSFYLLFQGRIHHIY